MPEDRIPRVPDDWTVWAFSDPHGVTSGLLAALREAGLVDDDGHWAAPPRTALVGGGDYIDRGGDIRGLVELLARLQEEAAAAGGAVLLARGNHEALPLMIRRGEFEWLETWLEYGGRETLAAFGCSAVEDEAPEQVLARLEAAAPWLFDWLEGLLEAVRWRDVLFVHGGLAPGHTLDDLGRTTDEHLWVRSGFFEAPWGAPGFEAYRAAGIERVVFGHTPQPDGLTAFHGGRSLCIDTNAVGNPRLPAGTAQALTLIGLAGAGSFSQARIVTIPTHDAPDAMRRPLPAGPTGPG
jgi:hypothetical protein